MNVTPAAVAIAGHAGIGHTHCPGGLIQDDTAGFAVAAAMLRDVLHADTRVTAAHIDPVRGTIQVITTDGGVGEALPRRGITPSEARLMQDVVGRDALLCQTTSIEVLGRMYGQGVMETPVALAVALANATIDTFRNKAPDRFYMATESVPGNCGFIGGMTAQLEGVTCSILGTVNASSSGIGPNEDLEGNVALGSKRDIMGQLRMLRRPTIVLEGKAYSPALSDGLSQNTFLVRAQRDLDNIVVAEALHASARDLGYPVIILDDVFPRNEGALRRKTVEVAERIIETAQRLKHAEIGADKVVIAAELARLVSEEVGGVSFMTDKVHDVVRQAGMIPGTSAVLSMLVTREHLAHWQIPLLTQEDITLMKSIVYNAIPRIMSRLDEANTVLDRFYEDLSPLEPLIKGTANH